MLLCVEVYPPPVTDGTSTSTAVTDTSIPVVQQVQVVQPLTYVQYASLLGNNTSNSNNNNNNNNNGIIWSTGRRSGNYQLVTDKTVSREHCIVLIGTTNLNFNSNTNTNTKTQRSTTPFVNNNESTNPGTSSSIDSFGGCNPLLLSSSTSLSSSVSSSVLSDGINPNHNIQEAIDICNQSKDQLCVLIQNVGKLGTFIIEEYYDDEEDNDTIDDQENDDENDDNHRKVTNNSNNNTNNNSDSETDDEMEAFIRSQQYNKSQNEKKLMKLSTNELNNSIIKGPIYTTSESFNEMSQQLYGVTLSPISEYLIFNENNNNNSSTSSSSRSNNDTSENPLNNTKHKRGIQSIIPITVVNEMKVLQSLALLNDDSTTGSSSSSSSSSNKENTTQNKQNKPKKSFKQLKRCIIQIGKLGTTIVITRMPSFHFIPSGPNTKQILDQYSTILYKIGCYTYNNNNNNNSSNRINVRNLLNANDQYRIVPWKKKKTTNTAIITCSSTLKEYMIQNYSSCYDVCYIVITTQYIASLKQLIAWACGIPIVSSSFLHSLFTSISTLSTSSLTTTSSSSSSSLLPSIHDHIPQSDSNAFWNQYPNPLLWNNYALLSLSASSSTSSNLKGQQQQQDNEYDLEQLILAGGATVVPILNFISKKEKQQQQQQNEIITKNILIETVQRIIHMSPTDIVKKISCTTSFCKKDSIDKLNYFVFGNDNTSSTQINIPISSSTSSSSNIVSNYESILVQEFPTSITPITAKHIAKSITTQTSILFPIIAAPIITAAASSTTITTTTRSNNNDKNSSSSVINTDVKNVNTMVDTVQSSLVANDQSKIVRNNRNDLTVKQQKQQHPTSNTSNSVSAVSVDKRGGDVVHSSPISSTQQQQQQGEENLPPSKVYKNLLSSNQQVSVVMNTNNTSNIDKTAIVTSTIGTSSSTCTNTSEELANRSNKKQIINHGTTTTTKLVGTTKNGWYEALPKHRTGRTKEEMRLQLVNKVNDKNEEVGEIRDVAITESIKGLIVITQFKSHSQSNNNNSNNTSTTSTNNTNSRITTIPDFKTFRKNSIVGVPAYNDTTKDRTNNNNGIKRNIRLISVLPKESDNRRDIEEQQRTLDEQERRADSLFQETRNNMSSHRRN